MRRRNDYPRLVFTGLLLTVTLLVACATAEPITPTSPKIQIPDLTNIDQETFETEQGPRSLVFDGEHMWVTIFGEQTVDKYSHEGENLGTFKAGPFPRALAFDGESIWVANSGDNSISKLSQDGELLDTVVIGTSNTTPSALACRTSAKVGHNWS